MNFVVQVSSTSRWSLAQLRHHVLGHQWPWSWANSLGLHQNLSGLSSLMVASHACVGEQFGVGDGARSTIWPETRIVSCPKDVHVGSTGNQIYICGRKSVGLVHLL
jgi:hypothetical protein